MIGLAMLPRTNRQQAQQDTERSAALWRRRISGMLIGDEIVADGRIVRRKDANLYLVIVDGRQHRVSERALGQTQRLVFDLVMGVRGGQQAATSKVSASSQQKQRADITRRTTGVQPVETKGGTRYRARLSWHGRQVSLGTFATEAEAVEAINAYVIQHGLKRPLLEVL